MRSCALHMCCDPGMVFRAQPPSPMVAWPSDSETECASRLQESCRDKQHSRLEEQQRAPITSSAQVSCRWSAENPAQDLGRDQHRRSERVAKATAIGYGNKSRVIRSAFKRGAREGVISTCRSDIIQSRRDVGFCGRARSPEGRDFKQDDENRASPWAVLRIKITR